MICFTPPRPGSSSTRCGRRGRCSCTAGRSGSTARRARVPVTEDEPRTAYGDYGVGKAEIEALLQRETLAGGVPSVVLHPGHITGPGWPVITPAGNLDPGVVARARARRAAAAARPRPRRPAPRPRRRRRPGVRARAHPPGGDRLELPRRLRAGDDAARAGHGRRRLVRPRAGARVRRLAGVRAARGGGPRRASPTTTSARSIAASIDRARDVLGYAPRYSSLEALHEALGWLVADGQVEIA